tara:strand:- start:1473 stop:1994 length:522 start_codon:yes stop_codon:yes gene_type:complete
MFKDFNIDKFKEIKPPSDNSFNTMQEIKQLQKMPLNKQFVNKFDDGEKVFSSIVGPDPLIGKLIKNSGPIIRELKDYFNRPRPIDLAKKFNLKLDEIKLKSMDSPAYPSGHAAQATLLNLVLSDKYPNKKKELNQAANNTIKSRHLAHTHYKSDSDMGKKLGTEMYEHIKSKV